MSMQIHSDALLSLLGNKGLITAEADMVPYVTGARYDMGKAAFVARPANTEETSKLLAYCAQHHIHLVPQSGNTGLVSASTPNDTGTQGILSLDRINTIIDLDIDNKSVHVSAGIRLSTLNEALEKESLFFPIDLGADPRIGGMIATNTGGTRCLRYGDVRANTLGLTVVLADENGTVLNLTNTLRKNNTGVDWKQMFIGTSGAFGVVTECVLNIVQKPMQSATAYLIPSSLEAVAPLMRLMEAKLGICLSAFEGMSKNAVSAAYSHVTSLTNPFPGGTVPDYIILAEVSRDWPEREGEQPLPEMLEAVLAEIWEDKNEPLADALIGRPEEMWALRHAISEGVKSMGKLIAFDVSFRRANAMRFTRFMETALPTIFSGVTMCNFGHVGDGGLHFNLVLAKDDPRANDVAFERELRTWVFDIVVNKFAGSYSAEHAIGPKNQYFYDLYTSENLKAMARSFKSITSPASLGTVNFG
ncbi:FAD-binding oxidoreductase [Kordiimonas pumila]|uniref:FAD-binding oxidoreductase n=1 Tax=Kordiimonas pumila TaxID=2161677 RepID=A0ABV7DAA1_9PROT|nr:FAD-binding oxidoreductase [Kordiimonas pumila]